MRRFACALPPTSPLAARRRAEGRRARLPHWGWLSLWLLASAACNAAEPWSAERLYRDGVHLDGAALVGARPDGASLTGSEAACVNCHRRSGLGTTEGKSVIPPIGGDYLFRSRVTNGQQVDTTPTINTIQRRTAYTEASLATALREGISSDGQPLSVLMPRYAVSDTELKQLIPYLKGLGAADAPGVTADTLHFATIVTPDADPSVKQAMLATLEQFFQDRNHIIAGEARPMQHNERGVMYRVTRRWALHIWELQGAAPTWAAQLARFAQEQPVFAVISGVGGRDWMPIHNFCEASKLPCLFPNIDTPPLREHDFYSVYFSRGLFLEGELMADALEEAAADARAVQATPAALALDGVAASGATAGSATAGSASASSVIAAGAAPPVRARSLIQVLRAGAGLEPAAQHLADLLRQRGWQSELHVVSPGASAAELGRALDAPPGDAMVLWLNAADIAQLPATPPASVHVWLSGLLGGLEQMPLPAAWRAASSLTYPLELPDRRFVAMRLPEGWFHIKHIDLVDPRVQFQTYVACQILSETVGELHSSFQPDFLVERLEVMLSHRRLNGPYPRLSLGVNQRFASKGGYLAHFGAGQDTQRLLPEGDWRTP